MSQLTAEKIAEWFRGHEVTYHESMETRIGNIEILRWQKPKTWVYGMDYILKGGTLCVIGDLGEAVYDWHGPVSGLEWIAGVSIDYFHGKCMASEDGRNTKNYEWDEDEARKDIFQHFKAHQDCKGYKKYLEQNIDLSSEFTLNVWCHQEDPYDVFGSDWWDWLPSCGAVIPTRTRAHLIGLKLIYDYKLEYC